MGFGLLAIACLTFFALLAGALVYVAVFGNPETKRWKAFAATHGWECDGPWRLSGGPPGARWTLGADDDDDRGTRTITWSRAEVPVSVPRLLVIRRVDYERARVPPSCSAVATRLGAVVFDVAVATADVISNAGGGRFGGSVTIEGRRPGFDGLHEVGVGGPRFRRHWVVLGEGARDGRTCFGSEAEAAWLAAVDRMPDMLADEDLAFEVAAPHIRLRAEGARWRPSFDQVEAFVRLGLALTARAGGSLVRDIGAASGVTS